MLRIPNKRSVSHSSSTVEAPRVMQKSQAVSADIAMRLIGPSAKPRQRLLLFIHIAASVGVFGADLALLILGVAAASGFDGRAVYPAAHLLASRLIVPLAALSLVTGVALALRAGMFKHGWVVAKFVITVEMTIAATFVLTPGLRAAANTVLSNAKLGDGSVVKFAAVPAVASALLLLNVALAIYKPARRLSSDHSWRISK